MKSIAIVVIAYNREKSLARLLNSISNAFIKEGTTLIVSIDKSNNPLVAKVANEYVWKYGKKEIVCHKENLGLRKHILGSGKYLDKYDAIIILEDDLVVSDNFLMYATQAVDNYFDNEGIAGISLYSFGVNYQTFYSFTPQPSQYDVYFMKCAQSWGQVWMKKQWKSFEEWYNNHQDEEFDSRTLPKSICSWSSKSWLKYHTRYCIETGKYFVYPYQSLSSNCGEEGTHLKFSSPVFQRPVAELGCNYNYRFPDIIDKVPKYDGFFEAESLYDALGLREEELCIDLTCSKTDYGDKRYILTTKSLCYNIERTFGLSYTPIELNVLKACPGEFIYLYDTKESNKRPQTSPIMNRVKFAYENHVDLFAIIRRLKKYGVINFFRTLHKSL